MFNTGSRPTLMKSEIELADSGLQSPDSSADSAKVGVWVWALTQAKALFYDAPQCLGFSLVDFLVS